MDKKLKKYIERYDLIQNSETYELLPNGGMTVLINQETNCEVLIENKAYPLESFQAMLMNAYEESVHIQSNTNSNLIAIRFKGAGGFLFLRRTYGCTHADSKRTHLYRKKYARR